MPRTAKVIPLREETDYLAALEKTATMVPKAKKSDIVAITPPQDVLPIVDQFIKLKGDEDNLKRDLASARSTIIQYAAPEIRRHCERIKAIEGSVRLKSSGTLTVLVSEREDYGPLAEASVPAIAEIVGADFGRLFASETKISVKPEATRSPAFMAELVQLSADFPGCLELKKAVVPTKAYHHARIFEPKVAGLRAQLELLQVLPVYALKVSE